MRVISVITGFIGENAYIVADDIGEEAVVVDPGDSTDKIVAALKENNLKLTDILLTHGHFDHIGAAEDLRQMFGAKIYVHISDADMLVDPRKNVAISFDDVCLVKPADVLLEDGEWISAAGLEFETFYTPGHTPGSVCYIVKGAIFSGDTLFFGSIGRTDFPGGNLEDMRNSLKRFCELEGDYKVYPGHGQGTTLEYERRNNPYMGM